jgi:hypothetical protein
VDEARLLLALSTILDPKLAKDLTGDFLKLRRDCSTATLERASSGKFVETFVQCCQFMATSTYDAAPKVDDYLNTKIENEMALPEGIRLCAGRLARSIYTLRNKRSIAHKNPIDPNTFDLALAHQGAAWIVAEFLRNAAAITMQEAGELIALIQTPVGTLVEEIDGTLLVHAAVSVKAEILILLHSRYPEPMAQHAICASMKARSLGTVKNRLGEMSKQKLIHGNGPSGYRLTRAGYAEAMAEIVKATNTF